MHPDNLRASMYQPSEGTPTLEKWRRRRRQELVATWAVLGLVAVLLPVAAGIFWSWQAAIAIGVATAAWLWRLVCDAAHKHNPQKRKDY